MELSKMFSQISYCPEPKVIGVRNGIYQLEIDEKKLRTSPFELRFMESVFWAGDIDVFLQKRKEIFDFNPKNLEGVLLKSAKVTDIMVFSPWSFGIRFIVSEKVVNVLTKNNVSKQEYHLLPIDIRGIDIRYFMLFIPYIPKEEIIFSRSIYYEQNDLTGQRKYFKSVDSPKEYEKQTADTYSITFDRICLPQKYQAYDLLDVIVLPYLYVSEVLLEELQSSEITSLNCLEGGPEIIFL